MKFTLISTADSFSRLATGGGQPLLLCVLALLLSSLPLAATSSDAFLLQIDDSERKSDLYVCTGQETVRCESDTLNEPFLASIWAADQGIRIQLLRLPTATEISYRVRSAYVYAPYDEIDQEPLEQAPPTAVQAVSDWHSVGTTMVLTHEQVTSVPLSVIHEVAPDGAPEIRLDHGMWQFVPVDVQIRLHSGTVRIVTIPISHGC